MPPLINVTIISYNDVRDVLAWHLAFNVIAFLVQELIALIITTLILYPLDDL